MKNTFRQTVIRYYCVLFYALLLFKWCNNMLLYQQQPLFIYDTFDVSGWLFMQSGLHQWLLHTKQFLLFDVVYYTAPLTLLMASFYQNKKAVSFAAAYVLIVNWVYLQCYFLYPISSYTIFIAWLIFPAIFITRDDATFALLYDGIRYFFLYFFLSAGVWKIINGSVFNPVQLSAVLMEQHKEMIASSPQYWLTHFYQFLIRQTTFSYVLYLLVTAMELSFLIGFFTKCYDRYLIGIYFVFLAADYFIMRIPYFETLPLLMTLYLRPVTISQRS